MTPEKANYGSSYPALRKNRDQNTQREYCIPTQPSELAGLTSR
jgi:hypothetical protein